MFPTTLLSLFLLPFLTSGLSNPDPETIEAFLPKASPAATIPAFPEQSDVAGCPLNIPDELFHSVKWACGNGRSGQLEKSRCCPVLAAWLYAAYSATALGRVRASPTALSGQSYELPVLPDDSETCVDDLGKALRERGIELGRANESCDTVYCYCGIRLHPLSCAQAFYTDSNGKLVGDKRIRKLEKDCLSPALPACSNCLKTLHSLNKNSSKSDERTTKMHNKDCQLMGLTWLLAKNTTAYIHTVSAVLGAIMTNGDASSCGLGRDGLPLAVDSSQIPNHSSSIAHQLPFILIFLLNVVLITSF
ncbi:uncharacterized GPI-anchored protein At4g28100 [Mercurialis annua]|uniref:uncharacterized GPI-anchored protein At4g28100 n=1 Tax=Mercurialis annua TaxID=3986 RepID=UPI0021602220|nr:uncharacterized GPI-anchored protein At4g28100 [Mercurialis annua]